MKNLLFILTILVSGIFAQEKEIPEKWKPFNFLIGKWEGRADGKWGVSSVTREYEYLMDSTFIFGKNRSLYEKQEKNPQGEIHVNWNIFSYDKARKKFVLRQFHGEDITNTYIADSSEVADGRIEFETEHIENFIPGWKAKEVYQIINEDEFIEIFYLAGPGKEYKEFVRGTFTRVK